MTLSLDRACGIVFNKLSELELDESTLIVFINDNGGPTDANASVNDPMSGSKANHLEGGIRIPFLVKWTGVIPEKSTYDLPVSTLDLLPTFYRAGGGDPGSLPGLDGVDLIPYLLGEIPDRPLWQLQRKYEGAAMKRMDDYRK